MNLDPSIIIESILQDLNLEYVREYKFHPKRKWRADFFMPGIKTICEIDGSVWTAGRHTRGAGYIKDCEKLNAAAIMGLKVLRYSTDTIRKNPAQVYDDLRYLKEKGA